MVDERTRSREPEPEPTDHYQALFDRMKAVRERINKPFVVRGDERPWEIARQGKLKHYSMPSMPDAVLPDLMVFREEIADQSGRHTHQGGLALLGTRGQGATLVDDEKVPWEAGDLIMLPVKPGGITHQHFNRRGPDEPAEWLAIIYQPYFIQLGAEFTQIDIYRDWEAAHGQALGEHDHAGHETPDIDYGAYLHYEPDGEPETLFDDLLQRRDRYRKRMARSQEAGNWAKVEAGQIEWEWNPQGKMKWYLHPAYDDRPVTAMLYAIQEIPPGSRSGKQHRQGGVAHYVLEGAGHTVVDGQRWEWSAGDYLGLPVWPEGLTVQHFNDDQDAPARFVVGEPMLFPQLGVDMGCGFEQLEPCPEYAA